MSKKNKRVMMGLDQVGVQGVLEDACLGEYIEGTSHIHLLTETVKSEITEPEVVESGVTEPEVIELTLQMHKKMMLSGYCKVENLGGGDVYVNNKVIYTGDSMEVEGDIVLYATCYPKVKLYKLNN